MKSMSMKETWSQLVLGLCVFGSYEMVGWRLFIWYWTKVNFFSNLLIPNWGLQNFSCQMCFSLTTATKMVAIWSFVKKAILLAQVLLLRFLGKDMIFFLQHGINQTLKEKMLLNLLRGSTLKQLSLMLT